MTDNHVAAELPAYINGTLDPDARDRVRAHLLACVACRAEADAWMVIAEASHDATALATLPSLAVMDRVWERIEARPDPTGVAASPAPGRAVWRRARDFGRLMRGQRPLLRPCLWVASAAAMALGVVIAYLAAGTTPPGAALGVVAPLVAAIGVAFIYGPEVDPGLELALATPTSPRLVLLSRLALVLGYDCLLALAATGVVAAVTGGAVTAVFAVWMGPLLLLAALSLLLALVINAGAAAAVTVGVWLLHLVASGWVGLSALIAVPGSLGGLWQTTPAVVLAALVLFVLALLYVPRQGPRARASDAVRGVAS